MIKAGEKLLRHPEAQGMFLGNIDADAGAGITAASRRPASGLERPETSDLHPVTPRQSSRDLAEYDVDDPLYLTLNEMPVCIGQPLHEFGSDHFGSLTNRLLMVNGMSGESCPAFWIRRRRSHKRDASPAVAVRHTGPSPLAPNVLGPIARAASAEVLAKRQSHKGSRMIAQPFLIRSS